ncbi:MAG: hypothetical protein WC934_12575 [Acidithiobacillus sp.]|jgi:hypothetical protein|uniref:hypothetical protein n=1 Tax=Acidithiobacillus sp. TaxID=1872118 RepID=UPI00355D0D77
MASIFPRGVSLPEMTQSKTLNTIPEKIDPIRVDFLHNYSTDSIRLENRQEFELKPILDANVELREYERKITYLDYWWGTHNDCVLPELS